jgi:NADH:ubiquinone oxidoreductase subunit E
VIGCTTAEVEDVVSYYVMFHRGPVGKYVLQVCTTLSCALAGAERVIEELQSKLGIKVGETDPDRHVHYPADGMPRRLRLARR